MKKLPKLVLILAVAGACLSLFSVGAMGVQPFSGDYDLRAACCGVLGGMALLAPGWLSRLGGHR